MATITSLDTFIRADAANLGGDWTDVFNGNNITSNSARGNVTGVNNISVRTREPQWPNGPQFSQVRYGGSLAAGSVIGANVRCTSVAPETTYVAAVDTASGAGGIYSAAAGTYTLKGAIAFGGPLPPGMYLGLLATSVVLLATYGEFILSLIIDGAVATGRPGMTLRDVIGAYFSAGDVVQAWNTKFRSVSAYYPDKRPAPFRPGMVR